MSSLLSATLTTATASDAAPSAPTSGSIFVTPFSGTRLDLSWGIVSGAVGYEISRGTTHLGP